MSQSTILILLPETAYNGGGTANIYNVTGNAQPAASYYLGNEDLQTVNINFSEVTGNLIIEASLATSPSNSDWFEVYSMTANYSAPANTTAKLNSDASTYTNIEGNFVYLRARIENFAHGIINFVKLVY